MTTKNNPSCASLMNMATRELGAFLSVVRELYGPEQAGVAAENWLEEFEKADTLPGSTEREWRLITISAATRLADRLRSDISCNTYPKVPEIRSLEAALKATAAN